MGLSASILLIGWLASRRIAEIVAGIIHRTPMINSIVKRCRLSNTELPERRMRQILRFLLILLSAWGARATLNSHPDISKSTGNSLNATASFIQLPAVVFIFDLLIIVAATFILFKALG